MWFNKILPLKVNEVEKRESEREKVMEWEGKFKSEGKEKKESSDIFLWHFYRLIIA